MIIWSYPTNNWHEDKLLPCFTVHGLLNDVFLVSHFSWFLAVFWVLLSAVNSHQARLSLLPCPGSRKDKDQCFVFSLGFRFSSFQTTLENQIPVSYTKRTYSYLFIMEKIDILKNQINKIPQLPTVNVMNITYPNPLVCYSTKHPKKTPQNTPACQPNQIPSLQTIRPKFSGDSVSVAIRESLVTLVATTSGFHRRNTRRLRMAYGGSVWWRDVNHFQPKFERFPCPWRIHVWCIYHYLPIFSIYLSDT